MRLIGAVMVLTLGMFAAMTGGRAEKANPIEAFESGLRPGARPGGTAPTRWALADRMRHHRVPGVAIAVVRDGRMVWAQGYGEKRAGSSDRVDADTVFSVGSVSKVAAATLVLKLVQDGHLALDADVNSYLRRWKVPDSEFTRSTPITLRMLLSHTGGLLAANFPDYQPGERLPSVIDTLLGQAPAKNSPIVPTFVPGSKFAYSGGGTTVAQLAVEDAMASSFPEIAQSRLFGPLRMARSTFVNPLPAAHGNIALAHDANGKPTALPRGYEAFPEMAASGLWTSANDLGRLVEALSASSEMATTR